MSDQDLARVRDIFKTISTMSQIDMRKRAFDVIKEFASNPKYIESRQLLLDLMTIVGALPIKEDP